MLVSALAFSVMSALVKLAGSRLESVEIAIFRGVITLVASWITLRRLRLSPWGQRTRWLLFRGMLGFGGLHCYFYAVTALPLAEATVIHFLNPILTALAAAVFLREPLRRTDLMGTALGFSGVILVARPSFLFGDARPLDPFALGIAVLGACFGATAYIVIRKLRETEHPAVVVFHFPLLTVPLTLPLLLPTPWWDAPFEWLWPTPFEWAVLLALGIATQIGQVKLTEGLHLEPAARATAVSYAQVVFALVWGALLFGETPTPTTLAGAALVALGTIVVARPRREPPVTQSQH